MTTTTQDLTARLANTRLIGATAGELKPGDVLYDAVIPFTGIAAVTAVRYSTLTVEIDLLVVTDDPEGPTADETLIWHSTLSLSKVPGVKAGNNRAGFWSSLNHRGDRRDISACAELVDALDWTVI